MSLMVLSKSAPPRIVPARASVGRPVGAETQAIERRATQIEHIESWQRIQVLGNRVRLAVVADRPDIAHAVSHELINLADRRLRQLGDSDDAA